MCLFQVRSLEQSNKLLEAEIDGIKGHHVKPSGLRLLYEDQLRELRRIADQMKVQRVRDDHRAIMTNSLTHLDHNLIITCSFLPLLL